MRKRTHLLVVFASLSLLLGACGEAATTGSGDGETAGVHDGDGDGSMNMCVEGATDCADTAVAECAPGTTGTCDDTATGDAAAGSCAPGVDCTDESAADCETDAPCDDAAPAGDCPTCDPSGDQRMNPSITIVQAFVDPSTSNVEIAPGSVPSPYTLFLQEAVVEGANVQVSFSGGEAPCFAVDHVEVVQDADTVAITVWAGSPDTSADCSTMTTSMQSVLVVLDADLGSRLLLDGSRMQGPENA